MKRSEKGLMLPKRNSGSETRGGKIVIEGSTSMPAGEMKSGTVIIKGKVSDLLPSKEEGTEEIEGAIFRKFTGDVNVGGKGLLLINERGLESQKELN